MRIDNANAFADWLADAAPGARVIYHEGYLARDRSRETTKLTEEERNELCLLAGIAWRSHERGLAHLVQQRIGYEKWAYLAIARPKPALSLRRPPRVPSTTDTIPMLA
jgi:hypothetical protein